MIGIRVSLNIKIPGRLIRYSVEMDKSELDDICDSLDISEKYYVSQLDINGREIDIYSICEIEVSWIDDSGSHSVFCDNTVVKLHSS